jgi:hypothetical protein
MLQDAAVHLIDIRVIACNLWCRCISEVTMARPARLGIVFATFGGSAGGLATMARSLGRLGLKPEMVSKTVHAGVLK